MREQDPAYKIYQRYRYAYDTYGYLFLSENTGEDSQGRRDGEQSFQEGKGSLEQEEALQEGRKRKMVFRKRAFGRRKGKKRLRLPWPSFRIMIFL